MSRRSYKEILLNKLADAKRLQLDSDVIDMIELKLERLRRYKHQYYLNRLNKGSK